MPHKYLGSRWTPAYYNHIGITELIAKNIDKFPFYLRRGGIYGHNIVILDIYNNCKPYSDYDLSENIKENNNKRLCRAYGLKYIINHINNINKKNVKLN